MGRKISDLQTMQALPLSVKILLTQRRIRDWVNEYGEDGVFVSFSGGKDSTVLLTIAREMYPGIKAIYVDTGLEYPEIRDFVRTWDNVEWLKPKLNFKQVIEKYGYPFISKEVSERVYFAQKYLTWLKQRDIVDRPTDRPTDRNPSAYGMTELLGLRINGRQGEGNKITETIPYETLRKVIEEGGMGTYKLRELLGVSNRKDGEPSIYNYRKYVWAAGAPFRISNKCCDVMKKSPVHSYITKTGRHPILGTMASESKLRTTDWLRNGCNGFEMKRPRSTPMSFWTEQDVLLYIYQRHNQIASVYGDVVKETEIEGQLDFEDLGIYDLGVPVLKTTGCKRTGCMFCGFGCHLEAPGEGRFERMKETHPKQYEWIMKPWENGGLGYKGVIDWMNEHGNLNIRY